MNDERIISGTPYDDVFGTLLNDCSELIIPVINEIFGENYSGKEKVVFSYEVHFSEYDTNEEKLEKLKAEYKSIMEKLDNLARQGIISAYTRKAVIEMSNKVLENIAVKYRNVREGVKSVMGGQILEYEAKTILRQGEMSKAREITLNLYSAGMDIEDIAKTVNVNISLVKEWLEIL